MPSIIKQGTDLFEDYNLQKDIELGASKSVDLTDIYTVLYELFKTQGVLKENPSEEGKTPSDKVSFSFSHPQADLTMDQTSVIFDIVERKLLTYETTAGSIQQVKPRTLAQYNDVVSGQKKSSNSFSYTNRIELTIISSSHEVMYDLLKYLETTFTRDVGYLLEHFTKLRYEGIYNNSLTNPNNPNKRNLYSKTMCIRVDTEATFTLLHEEIQEIKY